MAASLRAWGHMNDLQWKQLTRAKRCRKMAMGKVGAFLHHSALGQTNPQCILGSDPYQLKTNSLHLSSCSFSATGITPGLFYCFAQVTHKLEQEQSFNLSFLNVCFLVFVILNILKDCLCSLANETKICLNYPKLAVLCKLDVMIKGRDKKEVQSAWIYSGCIVRSHSRLSFWLYERVALD